MTKIEGRARGHGDAAGGPGIIAVEIQGAVGDLGESAVGVGTIQGQGSDARLRQAESGCAVADSSADGEVVAGGERDVVAEGDRPRAEV